MSNYVEKEVLHRELCKHLEKVELAKQQGKPLPVPNDIIGGSIIAIANGLAQKHNFRNYSWLDEMISDGIIAATAAINKYDPARSQNPFGFFTQCIYWAFQGRIKKENEENKQKREYMRNVLEEFYTSDPNSEHEIDKESIIALMDQS